MKVGFTCSSFDLLHAGHILMLKECKDECDYLVVGLQTDPTIDREEKNKPVQNLFERFLQLDAISHIDKIYVYETEEELRQLLYYVKPDIRFIGEDWRDKKFTGYIQVRLGQHEIHYNRRYGHSTSELRARVKDAD